MKRGPIEIDFGGVLLFDLRLKTVQLSYLFFKILMIYCEFF